MCHRCMQAKHARHYQHPPQPLSSVVQVRTTLAFEWSTRLDHLGIELGVPKSRLLQEGVLLLLRYHDCAQGLPEPIEPVEVKR